MSSSKYIDKICIIVTVLALIFTALFMSGCLPIEVMAGADGADEYFSYYDLNDEYDASSCTKITLSDGETAISGNGAYVSDGDVYITLGGNYILSGELSDGSVIVNAPENAKVRLLLNGVQINCSDTAALYVEQSDKTVVTAANGTENTISGGADFDENSKIDGAVYSKSDLSLNGGGTLNVNAEYKHALVCNDDLVITSLTLNATAPQDTVHANDSVRIKEANINLTAGDDGITVSNDDSTDYLYIASGNIMINECYEGLEAADITIDGGKIIVYSEDDGLNSVSLMTVDDGDISVINTNGNDADGFDSNSSIVINGGTVYISLKNSASNSVFDYGNENGGEFVINGGTIVAAGGSGMAESVSDTSLQASVMYYPSENINGSSTVTLSDADGNVLLSQEVEQSFSEVTISTPELEVGETYNVSVGENSEEITLDCVNYANSAVNAFTAEQGMQMQAGHGGDFSPGNNSSADSSQSAPPEKPSGDMGSDSSKGNMQSPPDMNGGNASDSDSNNASSNNDGTFSNGDSPEQNTPPQNKQCGGMSKPDDNSYGKANKSQDPADSPQSDTDDDSTMTYLTMDKKTAVELAVSLLVLIITLLFVVLFRSKRI